MSGRNKIYKILLVGDGNVGKTSIRRRYFGEGFQDNYNLTLGADFSVKTESLNNKSYVMQIWDLAGQPRFSQVRSSYYRGASGVILVFDKTNPSSFENIPKWLEEVNKNTTDDIIDLPVVLVGNKFDLEEEGMSNVVSTSRIEEYVKILSEWSNHELNYLNTSAKTNFNIQDIFINLIKLLDKE